MVEKLIELAVLLFGLLGAFAAYRDTGKAWIAGLILLACCCFEEILTRLRKINERNDS